MCCISQEFNRNSETGQLLLFAFIILRAQAFSFKTCIYFLVTVYPVMLNAADRSFFFLFLVFLFKIRNMNFQSFTIPKCVFKEVTVSSLGVSNEIPCLAW